MTKIILKSLPLDEVCKSSGCNKNYQECIFSEDDDCPFAVIYDEYLKVTSDFDETKEAAKTD